MLFSCRLKIEKTVNTWELRGTGDAPMLLALNYHGSFQLCNTGSVRPASAPCRIKTCWSGNDFFMLNACLISERALQCEIGNLK